MSKKKDKLQWKSSRATRPSLTIDRCSVDFLRKSVSVIYITRTDDSSYFCRINQLRSLISTRRATPITSRKTAPCKKETEGWSFYFSLSLSLTHIHTISLSLFLTKILSTIKNRVRDAFSRRTPEGTKGPEGVSFTSGFSFIDDAQQVLILLVPSAPSFLLLPIASIFIGQRFISR